MIADLKPYSEYKDSGLPWLGRVPRHWEVKRLKNWVGINAATLSEATPKDYQFKYVDIGSVGTGLLTAQLQARRFGGAPSRARRIVRSGDTIASTVRTYLKAVLTFHRIDEPTIASTGFAVLTPREKSLPGCVGYIAQSEGFTNQIMRESVGIAYPAISETRLANIPVCFPPLEEQASIVRFLDWANGRLERAIRAKRKVIALLNEQKQAIIHRAVTRGLDPNVPLKPSGIPWLGDIPAHWGIGPCLLGLTEKQVKNTGMQETRVLSLSYGRIIIKPEEKLRGLVPESFETYQIVEPGDIIIRPTDLQNDHTSLRVGIVRSRGIITSAYLCLVSRPSLAPDYAYLLLGAYDFMKVLYGLGSGMRQNLSFSDFKRLPILLPPLAEQTAIGEAVGKSLSTIAPRIVNLEDEITLLREYRTRLTADVVTGKLDVREAAERLPEEMEIAPITMDDEPCVCVAEAEAESCAEDEE